MNTPIKKHILTILALFLGSISSCLSQQTINEIHGSFVLQDFAFNYTYSYEPKGVHLFILQPLNGQKDIFKVIDDKSASLKTYESFPVVVDLKKQIDSLKQRFTSLQTGISKIKSITDSTNKYGSITGSIENLNLEIKSILELSKKISKAQSTSEVTASINEFKGDTLTKNILSQKSINDLKLAKGNKETLVLLATERLDSLKEVKENRVSQLESVQASIQQFVNTLAYYDPSSPAAKPSKLHSFSIELFKQVFIDQLRAANPTLYSDLLNSAKAKGDVSTELEDMIKEVFYTIKARINFVDTEPIAARVMLKRGIIPVYVNRKHKSTSHPDYDLDLGKVTLEFENGTIKNIEILLKPQPSARPSDYNTPIRFRNNMPIAISTKFHPDALNDVRIYDRDSLYILLGDVIEYYPNPVVDNENYAPANSVIDLSVDAALTYAELKKEKTSLIADVRIYTDFRGLEESQPNGLVQTEISRKIDLVSAHFQTSQRTNIAFFRYFEPRLTISKIEQKDKYLLLVPRGGYTGLTDATQFEVSSVQLYQYQFIRLGGDLNLIKWNVTPVNFQLLYGINWVGSSVADYVESNKKVEEIQRRQVFSTYIRPGFLVEVKPDGRWGGFIRYDFPGSQQILSNKYVYPETGHGIATLTFELFIRASNDNKLYFRYVNNWSEKSANFYQMQLGYKTSLFSK